MANKDKKNKTSFKEGDKAAEKWTLEEAKKAFEELVSVVLNDGTFLSFQDITLYYEKIPYSTFYYLIEKYPFLDSYKKQLNDIIISRINKGALSGDFVSTPSIWRMKQLGEKDKQEITQDIKVKQDLANLSTDELIKRANAIKNISE